MWSSLTIHLVLVATLCTHYNLQSPLWMMTCNFTFSTNNLHVYGLHSEIVWFFQEILYRRSSILDWLSLNFQSSVSSLSSHCLKCFEFIPKICLKRICESTFNCTCLCFIYIISQYSNECNPWVNLTEFYYMIDMFYPIY